MIVGRRVADFLFWYRLTLSRLNFHQQNVDRRVSYLALRSQLNSHYIVYRISPDATNRASPEVHEPAPAVNATAPKRRPKLDLNATGERKRGKSMFGLVLGTLNKAKVEDKERNASEAVCRF